MANALMPVPDITLYLTRAAKFEYFLRFGNITPADASDWTVRLIIRASQRDGSPALLTVTGVWVTPDPTAPTEALCQLLSGSVDTATLPARSRLKYYVDIVSSGGEPDRLFMGNLEVND